MDDVLKNSANVILRSLAHKAVDVLGDWFKDRKLGRVGAEPIEIPRSYLPALQKKAENMVEGDEPAKYIVVVEVATRKVVGFWRVPAGSDIVPKKGYIYIPILFQE